MSRRERVREDTREAIKAIARQQMADTGTGSISINTIARELEMTPSGFYRYFASRDALVTTMITDAYGALADVMEAADQSQPVNAFMGRMTAVMMAYRMWALDNPVDFNLIFGNPIPNYQNPLNTTMPVARRSIGVIFRILAEALAAGALHPAEEHRNLPPSLMVAMPAMESDTAHLLPPVVTYLGVLGWAHFHGILMLEMHRHTQDIVSDPEAFYRTEIRFLLRSVGLQMAEN